MRRRVVSRSGSSSSSGPRTARDPKSGLAAGGAEMRMRRREASAARPRPMVPVEPTAGGAASYSAVQLRRGQRTAHGPSWSRGRRCPAEHAARCRSCGVADGVVNQVGPSGTAHGSSELVKAHTPSRGRPSCRNNVWVSSTLFFSSLRSSRNSVQALLESRYCIQSTRFNKEQ